MGGAIWDWWAGPEEVGGVTEDRWVGPEREEVEEEKVEPVVNLLRYCA